MIFLMSDDLKDILNNSNKDIDNQKLMDYLSKQLSNQDSHELEKMMADDEFMNDAIEGLAEFDNVKKLPLSVEQLNRNLHKLLNKKTTRKEKRKIKDNPWLYFTIIFLLLLVVVCFVLVRMYVTKQNTLQPKAATAQLIKSKY
jgi:t-SNARE complex subunit (syntaxin)